MPWLKLALIALGALLIFASFFVKSEESEPEDTKEARIAELCSSIDGVGECRAVIIYEEVGGYFSEKEERIFSVAVFCEGADDIRVVSRIKSLVSAMYGIGTNRIEVLGIEKTKNN